MNSFKRSWKFLILCWLGFSLSQSFAQISSQSYCTRVLKILSKSHRALSAIEELKIGTYNVLDFGPQKSHEAIESIAEIIRENSPDILVLQEVQGFEFLSQFVRTHLHDQYDVMMTDIGQPRSIQTGFLVKKDLPFLLELDSHVNQMWLDPSRVDNPSQKLFPRDLPVLKISNPAQDPAQSRPIMLIMGVHLKSKRDRVGDLESRLLRKAQAERASQIVQDYQRRHSSALPVMLVGDFNGSVISEPEYQSFKALAQLNDAMLVEKVKPLDADKITHSFFPRDGTAIQSQIDYALVSPSLNSAVIDGEIYRYKDATGVAKALPQTRLDRDLNPSDHFPYFVRLNFSKVLDTSAGRKPNSLQLEAGDRCFLLPRSNFRVNFLALPAP